MSTASPYTPSPTSTPSTSADVTEILEQDSIPQIGGTASELTATRYFKIAVASNEFATFLASAYVKLVASYPLGTSLSAEYPLLRVVSHDVHLWTPTFAKGVVQYSSKTDNDIEYNWDIGASTVQTTDDKDGADLGSDPDGNQIVATIHMPTLTFTYARTESDYGYYDGATRKPWSSQRFSWGALSSRSVTSQRRRVYACTGKLNQTTFLGDNSGTWLFLGASSEEQYTGRWDEIRYRVEYNFAYRPYRARAWQYVSPYDGTTANVYAQEAFGTYLDLKWPTVEGAGTL